MMTGAHPHLLGEGVATTITTDVVEGEGETMVVVEDFAEEDEGEDPLVSTMMTMDIEVGETVEGEIATETTTSSREEGEGEGGEVVEITTTMTMITIDLRDRAREVDSEWDAEGEEEEEGHMAVGVVVDGHTKEEGDTITMETTVALGAEEEGGEE